MVTVRALAGMLAAGLLACGGKAVIDGDGASSSTSSSSSSATTTTGAGAQGMGGSGAGGNGMGASSPGPWRAEMWAGQVDHMNIRHHDVANDLCISMNATAPSGGGLYDASMPSPWALNAIVAWDEGAGCLDDPFTPFGESADAGTATGSISFVVEPMQIYPCELDVDMVVQFPDPPPWLPPQLTLKATEVKVEGACF